MIPDEVIKALSAATGISSEKLIIKPLVHGGLINRSFKMNSFSDERSWLLQNINHSIFTDPENLNTNYLALYRFSIQKPGKVRIPVPIFFSEGQCLFIDTNGEVWRAMEWIAGSCTIEKVHHIEQARDVAQTFALFTHSLSKDFSSDLLKPTLPHFHDLSYRYQQFEEAFSNASGERLSSALSLIEEMKKRSAYCRLFEYFKTHPTGFPYRVMHHDAKISNILFEEKTGKVWGPIDLDTVMPGLYFSDLGDMIRSLVGSIDENSSDLPAMQIKEDIYEELVNSYSKIMENDWTTEEKKYKHASGLMLVYMQTLRFLADHLKGDVYYQVSYPGQNLNRSMNQLILLQRLEDFLFEKYHFKV